MMNKEKQSYLYAKYPDLFREAKKTVFESCMGRGIECADGWADLIDRTCAKLKLLQTQGAEIVLDQVKEKFGALRIYWHGENMGAMSDEFQKAWVHTVGNVIGDAEAESTSICEVSGDPGSPHVRGGWFRTVSPAVAEKEGFTLPLWTNHEPDLH